MHYIKFILICLIIFFLIFLGFSWFIPSHVRVSRAINLAVNQDTVLRNIDDLSRWQKWYEGMDKVTLQNVQIENGKAVSCQASGITLKQIVDNDTLVTVTMTKSNRPVENSFRLIKYAHSDSITLQNYMDFNFKWYPWEKFGSLFFDKNYGTTMEKNLKNLKQITQ